MAVIVNVVGENDGSDEYAAAEKLRDIINDSIPKTVMGEIVLFPSATLYGQAVKDVDIMMIGELKGYSSIVRFMHQKDSPFMEDPVYLNSYCTTIEIKSHGAKAIRMEGTNLQVFYSNKGWHNATKQSNEQKTSAMNFFVNALGESPFVTNLIWLTEVNESELSRLLTHGNHTMPSNLLPSEFDFGEILQRLAYQKTPSWRSGKFVIDSGFKGNDANGISKPLYFFSKAKSGMGELTRKKIEQISNHQLGELEPDLDGNALNIFRGRAGTGKTIDLIKIAIKLVEEKGARVQLLTYNRALVADIRRLFTLAELPDMFDDKCVSVNTMQSYFFGLINECLYDGKLLGEEYLERYQELLEEMISFLKSDPESKDVVRYVCEDNPKLNWDYILIDEAQDWTEEERNLILLLYDRNKVLVADGGQQFVRSITPCDWTIVPERNSIKLKQCLRQKRNLVKFVNAYAELIAPSHEKMTQSDEMVGGKIIIIKDEERFFEIIKAEKTELKKAENAMYDFLFLVPSTLVENNGEQHSFKLTREFERNNILLWDGTKEDNRIDFAVNLDEARVLQYESARGLEGWTVCCVNFDEYMQIKEKQYDPKMEGNALFLESAEDKKNKYLLNWALIPLTRAIDTLIITLKDAESQYSKALIQFAEKCPDYIRIY